MSNVKSAVRKHLLDGVAKQQKVDELVSKLEDARAGMYVHGVKAAIAAKGDGEVFAEVCDTLAEDFRCNRRNIAIKYKCETAKTTDGKPKLDKEGNPVYKVPSSLSAMRSHLKGAFEYGVDLGTAKKPNPFSAIRDAVKVARDEKRKAEASPDDKARDAIREVLSAIDERIQKLEGKALDAAMKLLQTAAENLDKVA